MEGGRVFIVVVIMLPGSSILLKPNKLSHLRCPLISSSCYSYFPCRSSLLVVVWCNSVLKDFGVWLIFVVTVYSRVCAENWFSVSVSDQSCTQRSKASISANSCIRSRFTCVAVGVANCSTCALYPSTSC